MSDDRFASQVWRAEDLLKDQTVGLVGLDEFRKRRVEAIERSERDNEDRDASGNPSRLPSGAATPSDRSLTPQPQAKKRRKIGKGKLSFVTDEEDGDGIFKKAGRGTVSSTPSQTPRLTKDGSGDKETSVDHSDATSNTVIKRRLGPNTAIAMAPKIMTKSVLLKESQERERLRKEFLSIQEIVKASEISVPFVFYEGANVPGGSTKVKKGDPIWLFLDKCRKFGADLRIGGAGRAKSRRDWARVGVDDLMLVRKGIIIPHHYEFYYFVINKTLGRDSLPLFEYSSKPNTSPRSSHGANASETQTSRPKSQEVNGDSRNPDSNLEGAEDDPNWTKVVNRRWYERNKHIFPASTWEEFDPTKDYTNAIRRDTQGNAYFSQ